MKKKSVLALALTGGALVLATGLYLHESESEILRNGAPRPAQLPFGGRDVSAAHAGASASTPSTGSSKEKSPGERYLAVNRNAAYATLEDRMAELGRLRPRSQPSAEEVARLMEEPAAWAKGTFSPSDVDTPDERQRPTSDKQYIAFNARKIETLLPGDKLEIPIEAARATYVMTVESVQNHGNGDITWSGSLDDDSGTYPVTFTQNEAALTVGGVSTPAGHFLLEVRNGKGWILTSRVMGDGGSGEPDFATPPR